MRLVIQRVREASVSVEDRPVAQIGAGALVFVGCSKADTGEALPDVASGAFQAHMLVALVNDGPVTPALDCPNLSRALLNPRMSAA